MMIILKSKPVVCAKHLIIIEATHFFYSFLLFIHIIKVVLIENINKYS